MPNQEERVTKVFKGCGIRPPLAMTASAGTVVAFSTPSSERETENEDAAGVWDLASGALVLAVADGLGGGPSGAEAAATAIDAIGRFVENGSTTETLRSDIIDGFEHANQQLLEQGIGSATTLVVIEIQGGKARAYHAGDSGAILVGQRGRLRLDIMPHSPVGYAVASGILEQDDTHHHDERHLLSNCIGSREMRVEMGAPVQMAARDTLLLATDGVLDNIQRGELIELIRKGQLGKCAAVLQERIEATMAGSDRSLPALPDDATALLFRRAN